MKAKTVQQITGILLFGVLALSWKSNNSGWKVEHKERYDLYYTDQDSPSIEVYTAFFEHGIGTVEAFFDCEFRQRFEIRVHPDRNSLDSAWQADWMMPDFTSECWMVASGVARKLDVLSPGTWDSLSCEHSYSDKTATQRLLTHELVHVLHGQYNVSPDFSDVHGIDWFVEGLATYASGQCDRERMMEVKEAVKKEAVPKALDDFWTGQMRYGLSGSVVMYIDKYSGRKKLRELLRFNTKVQVLEVLKISEEELLKGWADFVRGYE